MAVFTMWSVLLSFFTLLSSFCASGKQGTLIQLNEDNWYQMTEGEWMVEFLAPWCPACKGLQPIWEEFASWSDDLGIHVGQVDVTTNPGLSGRFMVTALPTIFHVKDGRFRQYRGARDTDEFTSFIEDKKWTNLEEVPGWKSPSSIQMSVVSSFFKLSMVLRAIHNTLVEQYNFPYWGSLLLFAVTTILFGAILGLVIVCIVDFIFPPKRSEPLPATLPSNSVDTTSKLADAKSDSESDKDSKEDKGTLNEKEASAKESPAEPKNDVRKRKPVKKDE